MKIDWRSWNWTCIDKTSRITTTHANKQCKMIEKKISENAYQNQTYGQGWSKLYIPKSELTWIDNIRNW